MNTVLERRRFKEVRKLMEMCPVSTMKDMYEIVKESDKVVTF